MRVTGLRRIRQGSHPVVRHLYLLPVSIIEFLHIRTLVMNRVRLCQIVKILCSTAEVLLRISSMTQLELPTFIQADRLTDTLRVGY